MNHNELKAQFESVKKYPTIFLASLFVILIPITGMIWVLISKHFEERIESCNERLKLRDDNIAELAQKLKNKGEVVKVTESVPLPKNESASASIKTRIKDAKKPFNSIPTQTSAIQGNGNVISQNQSGGITAGSINFEKPPRSLLDANKTELLARIPRNSIIRVIATMNNQESFQFAEQHFQWLNGLGAYRVTGVDQAIPSKPLIGQQLYKLGSPAIFVAHVGKTG
jgi:hypothetical protein